MHFVHGIFFLKRGRDDAKESSGLRLGSGRISSTLQMREAAAPGAPWWEVCVGVCIILSEFLLDTDFHIDLLLIKPS